MVVVTFWCCNEEVRRRLWSVLDASTDQRVFEGVEKVANQLV